MNWRTPLLNLTTSFPLFLNAIIGRDHRFCHLLYWLFQFSVNTNGIPLLANCYSVQSGVISDQQDIWIRAVTGADKCWDRPLFHLIHYKNEDLAQKEMLKSKQHYENQFWHPSKLQPYIKVIKASRMTALTHLTICGTPELIEECKHHLM